MPTTRMVNGSYISPSSARLTNTLLKGERVLDSDLVNNYKAFFINVERFDSGNLRQSDIELNEIVEESRPPEFVTEFEERLDSRPGIAPDVCNLFDLSVYLLVLIVSVDA